MIKLLLSIYKRFLSEPLKFLFGGGCRFQPPCSDYTKEAISRFGVAKGIFLGVKRFLSCHPFGRFGYDPVPDKI